MAITKETLLFRGARDAGYLPADVCAECHGDVSETYRHTGMGRSFYRPKPENTIQEFSGKSAFYHPASDRHYQMIERNGRFFQRRYQTAPDGSVTNVVEKEIHFVVGSGNHARTYLHQTRSGGLVELPLAWYSADGGYWAMNPGYDRPNHEGFRRRVTFECIFCHNGYAEMAEGSDLSGSDPIFPGEIPEGIDCQRCHGPGRDHIEAVESGGGLDRVLSTIVNPAKLDPERQLEVCLQCHLESTSLRLPPFLRRFGRGVFSYRPGMPLGDYMLSFDHAPGTGYDDKFEIAHQGYRLRKSACFQASEGRLGCTNCHDPHSALRGEEARRHYVAVCQGCHQDRVETLARNGRHTRSTDCLSCHMPKRRTEDVIHVVMTDHFIQRRLPAGDLLAPREERHATPENAYTGDVVLSYPHELPFTAENELYLAVAQVKHNSNLSGGIPRLGNAIEKFQPRHAEFYFELGKAYSESGRLEEAVQQYEGALRLDPDFWPALHRQGLALARLGRLEQSANAIETAREAVPTVAVLPNDLGMVYVRQQRFAEAAAAFRQAIEIDPDFPDAYNNLGGALKHFNDFAGAERAYREAVRHQPDFAPARHNLATVLAARGDFAEADDHFRKSIESDARYAPARIDYGRTLIQRRRHTDAFEQLNAALNIDPESAEAHSALGDLLMMQGRAGQAVPHYRRAAAARPDDAGGLLDLGIALAEYGQLDDARRSLEAVLAADSDHIEAHFHLGRVLATRGLQKEAIDHLSRVASGPETPFRNEAAGMLKSLQDRSPPR